MQNGSPISHIGEKLLNDDVPCPGCPVSLEMSRELPCDFLTCLANLVEKVEVRARVSLTMVLRPSE